MLSDTINPPSPPVPGVLTHNVFPTSTEESKIRNFIAQIDVTIAGVDAEIARLISSRDTLQQSRDQHAGAISPLRRMPNELISKFMANCLVDYGVADASPHQRRKIAFVLASVCSRWHSTAISTPQLWTIILLQPEASSTLIPLMLSRSGDCDLEIHAYEPGQRGPDLWWKAIKPHLRRVVRCFDHRTPYLRHFFGNAYFGRLRILEFECMSPASYILEAFQKCPILEEVKVCIGDYYEAVSVFPSEPVIMSQLRRLRLSYNTDPSKFIDSLTTPNLVEFFTFKHGGVIGPWPEQNFVQLLQRSKATLRKFGLAFSESTCWLQITNMIGANPHLVEYHIDESGQNAEAIYSYLSKISFRPITPLPELKTLVIRNEGDYMNPGTLHTLIASRAAEFPLKKIVLSFQNDSFSTLSNGSFAELLEDAEELGYTLETITDDKYTQ